MFYLKEYMWFVHRLLIVLQVFYFFFFSSRRRHTRLQGDWSSDVCSSDLVLTLFTSQFIHAGFLHLGGNMVFLWVFGRSVEDRLGSALYLAIYLVVGALARSEERRVGKECRSRWSPYH